MSDEKGMIERVARAICSASGDYWREPPLYLEGTDNLNNHWRQKARAAIQAMREPTDAVLSPAGLVIFNGDHDLDDFGMDAARQVINAAIEAALAEQPDRSDETAHPTPP